MQREGFLTRLKLTACIVSAGLPPSQVSTHSGHLVNKFIGSQARVQRFYTTHRPFFVCGCGQSNEGVLFLLISVSMAGLLTSQLDLCCLATCEISDHPV